MESTEPIQMSEITSRVKTELESMGLTTQGAGRISSIVSSHVTKNAVLNDYSKKTLRIMLWTIVKVLYKDMAKNRKIYGQNVSKETVVSTVRNTLFLALNRGIDGKELNLYYGRGMQEQVDEYIGKKYGQGQQR